MSNARAWANCWKQNERFETLRKISVRTSMLQGRSTDGRWSLSSSGHSVYTPFLRRFTDEPARELSETISLYHQVRRAHDNSPFAQKDVVDRINGHCVEVITKIVELPEYVPLGKALDRCQSTLIAQES